MPEPATIALIGLGILGMGAAQRRKTPAALPV
ncbi:PEP-CTERM sorting domain-containing protein [Nitrosomonas europaea]